MSTVKMQYGTSNQSITCTFTSLSNSSVRGSVAVDNTSNLYVDILVFVKIKTASSSTSSTGYVNVYAYGTADGGTTYTDGVTGTDASQTLTSPTNLKLIGIVNCVANSTTYYGGPFSVASVFYGSMPDHWGICIENKTGATLDASIGSAWYQGIYNQII